jgi:hypothetical protein
MPAARRIHTRNIVYSPLQDGYVLHPDLLNPRLLEAQYAVRGELYLKAEELKKTRDIIYTNGEEGGVVVRTAAAAAAAAAGALLTALLLLAHDCVSLLVDALLPLLLPAAVGNPQALGAKPLTFVRQVRQQQQQ